MVKPGQARKDCRGVRRQVIDIYSMELIKKYSQFVNERQVQGQLQQLALTVAVDMPDNKYIYDPTFNTGRMWKLITKEEKHIGEITQPVLNYSNWNTDRLIDQGYDSSLVYNSVIAKEKVSSKKDWHVLHEGSAYLPKSVYAPSDIKNLSFPVVAKPDNRYAGQGIVVFDRAEDTKGVQMEQFAVFSEKIDIKEEFRVFCWRGEPLMTVYRVPANDETENLSKDPKDKLKFNYELADNIPQDAFEPIKEFNAKHSDLDFYSVDFARAGNNRLFIIEMSSEPGPIFGILGEVYKRMYVDHHGQELQLAIYEQINKWIQQDIDATIASEPGRFKRR